MQRLTIFLSASILASVGAVYAAAAEPTPGASTAKAQGSRERIICRRFTRIGSLVDGYRVCKTRAEWDREHENLQHLGTADSCSARAEGGAGCNP